MCYVGLLVNLGQKKNYYIGVTRPTLKLGPTLHLKKTKQTKKQKRQKKWPIDPKKSKTCDFFFFFNTARKNVTTLLHWADGHMTVWNV